MHREPKYMCVLHMCIAYHMSLLSAKDDLFCGCPDMLGT